MDQTTDNGLSRCCRGTASTFFNQCKLWWLLAMPACVSIQRMQTSSGFSYFQYCEHVLYLVSGEECDYAVDGWTYYGSPSAKERFYPRALICGLENDSSFNVICGYFLIFLNLFAILYIIIVYSLVLRCFEWLEETNWATLNQFPSNLCTMYFYRKSTQKLLGASCIQTLGIL